MHDAAFRNVFRGVMHVKVAETLDAEVLRNCSVPAAAIFLQLAVVGCTV